MKTGTILLIAGAALVAAYAGGLFNAGNTMQIVFSGINPISVFQYQLTFQVQNVTGTLVNLKSLAGTVYLNGTNVGNVSNFTNTPIAGNASTPINVTLDLSAFGAVTSIYNLLNTSGTVLNFEVKGNMNVNSLVLPFDVTQSITVP